jgi:2'-5' RNA ligase
MSSSIDPARYFVALLPPPDLQAQITKIKQEVWETFQSRAALKSPPHITLQPPFLWPEADIGFLRECLSKFAQRQPSVPVTLSGFGAFPPRVIYVDVARQGRLMTIQPELMDYLAENLGIVDKKAQQRRFAPHLTVAFRDLKPANFRRAWPRFEQRGFEAEFMADTLTLLKHDGIRWQIYADFPFRS